MKIIQLADPITGLLHVRKTITFADAAGQGQVGQVVVFTVTGRVLLRGITAICTVDLVSAGGGSVSLGTTNLVDFFIAATTATAIDANEWWANTTQQAGAAEEIIARKLSRPSDIAISNNIIIDVTVATVTAGTFIIDAWYLPITDGAGLA